jgi:hypothetical protein
MRKYSIAAFLATMVLSLFLTACKDTKALQENEQLKAQVAQLQKDNGVLGNQLETLTADRNALAKENEALKTAGKKQEVKRTVKNSTKRKLRRSRTSRGL